MKVVPVSVEYGNPLVNKYLNKFSDVGRLFEHNPAEEASFKDRYDEIMRDYRTDRGELVRILNNYNERLGCGEKTRENIGRLADSRTVAVITGQQAGMLTGPLYTVYKAITAIQLAAEVGRRSGIQAVPMFWVAAEDHDYAEIDHLHFINAAQDLTRIKLNYTPPGKYSVGHIPVTDAVSGLIDELAAGTNPSEWKDDIIHRVRESAAKSDNLADWFASVMTWLFRKQGLVMVNPLNRGLRGLLGGTLQAFLEKTGPVNEKFRAGADRVRELGGEPQVETAENNVHLFLYVDGERLPLLRDGSRFTVRGRELSWSLDELIDIARQEPERLSPNVVLRPVAQDALLPILAYVAGPGEISYYSLYRGIYPLFGQRMPVIYPRVNITLIERGTAKHMDKYGVSFAEGAAGLREKLDKYLVSQDRLGIDGLFEAYSSDLKRSFAELTEKVARIDPELVRHGTESLNKMLHQLDHFEKKTRQYHRKASDTVVKRFHNMESQLFPRNNWQERVLNIFPYLFKYGPGLIDDIAELPLLGDFRHKLVYF